MHYVIVVWVVCCLPCSLIPCISFLSLYMCNIFSCSIKSLALNGSFVLFLPLFPSFNFLYIILFFHVPGGVVKNWALWDFIKLRTFFWLCNLSPFLHQNLAKGTSEHHRSIQNPPVSPTTASRILFEVTILFSSAFVVIQGSYTSLGLNLDSSLTVHECLKWGN
jgi:hypothetical protein